MFLSSNFFQIKLRINHQLLLKFGFPRILDCEVSQKYTNSLGVQSDQIQFKDSVNSVISLTIYESISLLVYLYGENMT